jgi:hypothetical protein
MGYYCCYLTSGSYVWGWVGWSWGIAKLCSLPLTKAFAYGQISRKGGGFDAWCMSGLAGWIVGGCNEGRTDGLAIRFIVEHLWNW